MMNAGKYYVGDLCYVLHDEWDEVCSLMFKGRADGGCNQGEFNLKDGRRFAVYNTAYGDGTYVDNLGNEYWVDAGCIGCIMVADIDLTESQNNLSGGTLHQFAKDFQTSTDGENLTFGHVTVMTGDYDRDPEEEYEDEAY
jgi:hypothetical protein